MRGVLLAVLVATSGVSAATAAIPELASLPRAHFQGTLVAETGEMTTFLGRFRFCRVQTQYRRCLGAFSHCSGAFCPNSRRRGHFFFYFYADIESGPELALVVGRHRCTLRLDAEATALAGRYQCDVSDGDGSEGAGSLVLSTGGFTLVRQ